MTDNPNQVLLVDFDGVLCEYDGWHGPRHFGEPIQEMIDAINYLVEVEGYRVVIYTTRADEILNGHGSRTAVIEWLQRHKVLYDRLVAKPLGIALLDDRAINATEILRIPQAGPKARARQILDKVATLVPLKGEKV